MIKRIVAFTAALALSAVGMAQTLTGLKVEPAEIKAGDTATVTVGFSVTGGINCGLRVFFGDGPGIDYKINQQKDVPLVVPHIYSKPGEFTLMAQPQNHGTLLKCEGKSQYAKVKVAGVMAAAPKSGAGAPKSSADAAQCPEGWTLDSKSAKRKDGSFTCKAAAGTKPATRVTCPGDLTYFENVRKGILGCRP